jgi:hypothetical protein
LGRDNPGAYTVRAGAHVAAEHLSMSEVMTIRFGDPLGHVKG